MGWRRRFAAEVVVEVEDEVVEGEMVGCGTVVVLVGSDGRGGEAAAVRF